MGKTKAAGTAPPAAPPLPLQGPRARGRAGRGKPAARTAALVAGLLLIHLVLALTSARQKSPTYDELYHLTRGYTYWQTGDFRMAPPHPPLMPLWAAFPLGAAPAELPSFDAKSWQGSNVARYGWEFFYEMGNPLPTMLIRARAKIALLSVALGLAVFFWSRHLFGTPGGLLSLLLYAFSPSLLAHARLVTTDLGVAAFFLFAAGGAWWTLHRLSVCSLLCSSLAFAGLFLSKMSAFLILPVLLVLVLIRLVSRTPLQVRVGCIGLEIDRRLPRLGAMAAILFVHLAVACAGIWAAYGFRYHAFDHPLSGQELLPMPYGRAGGADPWEYQYRHQPRVKAAVEFGRRHRLLPELYLYSIALGSQVSRERPSFLNGEYSSTGFRSFFPYCLLYKTPLPLLAILACAGFAPLLAWRAAPRAPSEPGCVAARRCLAGLYRTAPLWLLLIGFGAMLLRSPLNIGHRHILPIYPPLFVLGGAATTLMARPSRVLRPIVPVLALLAVIAALRIHPHYLAYFNGIAGGPAHGYRHLVDSSLDWGQDLLGLSIRLRRTPSREPVFLAYFGNAPPSAYGIDAVALPFSLESSGDLPSLGPSRLTAGTYCISATHLQQAYYPGLFAWTEERERDYWTLLSVFRALQLIPLGDPATLAERVRAHGAAFERNFLLFQRLRFGKLCAYLRRREPDDHVGYSILIYRLSDDEIREALYQRADPPSSAIAR